MKMKKSILGVILGLAMVLGLMPAMSKTALAYDGNPYASLVNTTTVVTFNNKPWYIIEDNSTAKNAGTVTLLAADTSFGLSKFNESSNDGNTYSTSKVKAALDGLTTGSGPFANVADLIVTNTAAGGKLYLLSVEEANNCPSDVRVMEFATQMYNGWWLRTAGTNTISPRAAFVIGVGAAAVRADGIPVDNSIGVRPALRLDLSKVVFDSTTNTFNLPTPYPLWVGGVQVTSANATDTTAHPTWSYDVDTNTLTLSGVDITTGYQNKHGIKYEGTDPFNIVLEDDNSIVLDSANSNGIYAYYADVAISGTGSLTAKGVYTGITGNTITISDGTVTATNTWDLDTYGALHSAHGVTISGGTVTAIGAGDAACGIAGIYDEATTITGGTVTLTGRNKATNKNVKNSFAGTGWSDVAGTEGETAIEINTEGQNLGSYKKVVFMQDPATVTAAPAATNPVYNGSAQELVTAGTAEGGTMQYALGENASTAPTSGWSEAIPTGIEVGTYNVWYKAAGDAEHSDSDPQCVQSLLRPSTSYVPYKAPTTTEPGNKAYYNGSDGKMYWDALALSEITDPSEVIIPPTGVMPVDNSGSGSSSSGGSGGGGGGGGNTGRSGSIVISNDGNKQYLSSVFSSAESGGNWNYDASDRWYYTRPDGSTPRNEWVLINYQGVANWYAFDENGAMRTGWFSNNGETYYLEQQHNGAQGEMTMGWKLIGDRWYYFEPATGIRQGRMYHGEKTPDGYVVGEDGGWDGNPAMIGR